MRRLRLAHWAMAGRLPGSNRAEYSKTISSKLWNPAPDIDPRRAPKRLVFSTADMVGMLVPLLITDDGFDEVSGIEERLFMLKRDSADLGV